MAIKRYTTIVELDDTVDQSGETKIPPTLQAIPKEINSEKKATGIRKYETEDTEAHIPTPIPISIVGRTFPDLVIELKNSPQAMATILMFLPFIFFFIKINNFESLKTNNLESLIFPLLIGIFLNIIWFGISKILKTKPSHFDK